MSAEEDTTRTIPSGGLPERLGPCRLLEPLGSGGMGTVYLAEMMEERRYASVGSRVARL